MKLRMHRLLGRPALAALLATAAVGCAGAPVVVTAPHRDWVADQCHQTIRVRALEGFGRRAEMSFDTPEHYYVSRSIEGVRGGALRRHGGGRDRIAYDCTVDIHSGRVQTARFRVSGAGSGGPPSWLSDARSVELCQQAIASRARAEGGRRAAVAFDSGAAERVSRFEREVRGRGALRVGRQRDPIAYECRIDVRDARVASATYHVVGGRAPSDRQLVEACQQVTREMVAADHGRRAAVGFETAETFAISKRERSVEGRGVLTLGRDRDPIHYACTLDARTARVSEARYRPVERPRDQTRRSVALCHAAVRERVESDRGVRSSTVFETSEVYFVSGGVEGVRGDGVVRHALRGNDPISYDCQVNLRRGHVAEARYRYR